MQENWIIPNLRLLANLAQEGQVLDLDKKSLDAHPSTIDIQQIFTTVCQALSRKPRVQQWTKEPKVLPWQSSAEGTKSLWKMEVKDTFILTWDNFEIHAVSS